MAKFHIDFTKHSLPVQKAAHAIGLEITSGPTSGRARPSTGPTATASPPMTKPPDFQTWQGLCENGYAKKWPNGTRGNYTFHLTRAGLDWLGETLGITIHNEED